MKLSSKKVISILGSLQHLHSFLGEYKMTNNSDAKNWLVYFRKLIDQLLKSKWQIWMRFSWMIWITWVILWQIEDWLMLYVDRSEIGKRKEKLEFKIMLRLNSVTFSSLVSFINRKIVTREFACITLWRLCSTTLFLWESPLSKLTPWDSTEFEVSKTCEKAQLP